MGARSFTALPFLRAPRAIAAALLAAILLTASLTAAVAGPPVEGMVQEVEGKRIHPTQYALGLARKQRRDPSPERRAKLLGKLETRLPKVIRGPGGELYVADGHHFIYELLHQGIRKFPVDVIHDWSSLGVREFWERMEKTGNALLLNRNGKHIAPSELPRSILDMPNDPYVLLAKELRERNVIHADPGTKFFFELRWAIFLREEMHGEKPEGKPERWIEDVYKEAARIARSKRAQNMPGHGRESVAARAPEPGLGCHTGFAGLFLPR